MDHRIKFYLQTRQMKVTLKEFCQIVLTKQLEDKTVTILVSWLNQKQGNGCFYASLHQTFRPEDILDGNSSFLLYIFKVIYVTRKAA